MNRPWMPLYVADYLADTAHLGALESGAYLHLIMHYWQTGGLPDDARQLALIAKVSAHSWKKLSPVLQKFFHDGWKHKRIEEELAKVSEISEKRRDAANRRHGKQDANAPAIAVQKHTHSHSHTQKKKDTEATASDAVASPPVVPDPRADLFNRGRQTLERITGKTPDSARALIGRFLKLANDEAVAVLGAIEDADRNRIADPVPWINRALGQRARGDPGRGGYQNLRELAARMRQPDAAAFYDANTIDQHSGGAEFDFGAGAQARSRGG
jgi:uncharacterized protein YdaU (DUF1376 family)